MSKVKLIPGMISLLRMAADRKRRIEASDAVRRDDPITALAKEMHPEALRLTVTEVRVENESVRTYRFAAREGALPLFQAGQYISVKQVIDQVHTSRAYTLSSAPWEAEAGYYEITVRKKPGGLVSTHIFDTWAVGTDVDATGPHGDFFYQPLRDGAHIVALAGGTGITPFVSMMKQFLPDASMPSVTLLYGCRDAADVLFEETIREICAAAPDRFRRCNTYERTGEDGTLRQGLIDAAFLRECVQDPADQTYFICGPQVMYDFLRGEFPKVASLARRQTRFEVGGAPADVKKLAGFPEQAHGKTVMLRIRNGIEEWSIPASSEEPMLVAIERAGLLLDSRCRSGECGICRSKLVGGEVFILPDHDGRREADRALGYIHPCSTYPLSDAELIIPPGAAAQT